MEITSTAPVFTWSSYISAIVFLLFMLLCLYFLLYFVKKYSKKGMFLQKTSFNSEDLKIENKLYLDNKKCLYVIKYLDKYVLLGATDQSINVLSEDYIFVHKDKEVDKEQNKEQNPEQNKYNNNENNARQEFEESIQEASK